MTSSADGASTACYICNNGQFTLREQAASLGVGVARGADAFPMGATVQAQARYGGRSCATEERVGSQCQWAGAGTLPVCFETYEHMLV